MKKIATLVAAMASLALVVGLVAGPATGAKSAKKQSIADIASGSKQFETLTSLLAQADLVETLDGKGKFTVFAPTDAAFAKLPKGTVESLLKPENKGQLTKILTAHVVSTSALSTAIAKMAKEAGGNYEIKTVSGDSLWVSVSNGKIQLKDESGGTAMVTIADVRQSNGVIHVVDRVLLPK
jgi:uncharacterized surface protein with fasciclin (FAS1) repeats